MRKTLLVTLLIAASTLNPFALRALAEMTTPTPVLTTTVEDAIAFVKTECGNRLM